MLVPRLRTIGLPLARRWGLNLRTNATVAGTAPSPLSRAWGLFRRPLVRKVTLPLPIVLGGAYATYFLLQEHFGSADDFFESKFITTKDPGAIAEFYQAEDLLRIIAIHPFLFDLFMNQVVPDTETMTEETALLSTEETHINVHLLGMEVSFEIIETEEEIDGEEVITSFIRHERFVDWVPLLNEIGYKIRLWDQTWKYGFERLPDGTYEVYHSCESYKGPWPIRVIVVLHQRYVAWACQRFINGDSFGTEDPDTDAQQEELANIPADVVKRFLHKLQAEKEHALESKRKMRGYCAVALKKEEAALAKLKEVAKKAGSKVKLAKRRIEHPFGLSAAAKKKLVVGDADTQAVISEAMKEAKGNHAVKAAVDELLKHPDLEWSDRKTASKVKTSPEAAEAAEAAEDADDA